MAVGEVAHREDEGKELKNEKVKEWRGERKTNTSQVCREQFVNYLFFIYICFDFHEAGRVGE